MKSCMQGRREKMLDLAQNFHFWIHNVIFLNFCEAYSTQKRCNVQMGSTFSPKSGGFFRLEARRQVAPLSPSLGALRVCFSSYF